MLSLSMALDRQSKELNAPCEGDIEMAINPSKKELGTSANPTFPNAQKLTKVRTKLDSGSALGLAYELSRVTASA
jgi:hypothetical protein